MTNTMDLKIAEFDAKPKFVKYHTLVMADIQAECAAKHKEVLGCMYKNGNGHFVIAIIEDMAIIERLKGDFKFTSALLKGGKWHHVTSYHQSIEYAMLDVIGLKHDGLNGRFAAYAGAMIGLDRVVKP